MAVDNDVVVVVVMVDMDRALHRTGNMPMILFLDKRHKGENEKREKTKNSRLTNIRKI